MSLSLLGLAGAAALVYMATKRGGTPASAPPPVGSTAPPAAPLRAGNQVAGGRPYFVEVFAGNLARVTGQAVQLTIKLDPATKRFQVVSQAGQAAAIQEAIAAIPSLTF